MSFRRRIDHRQQSKCKAWIEQNRTTLKQIGLPPIVYLDHEHWADFLDNGYLDHHADTTHFAFTDLSGTQLMELARFLEEQYGSQSTTPRLLSFLRARLQYGSECP